MITQINLTTDLDAAMRNVDRFFWKQIPFALSGAMNSTMFDVRKKIVTETYPKAFDAKNKRFANVLWRITKKASKRDLHTVMSQVLDRDYIVDHITGGVKTPRGRTIAIPAQPNKVRGASGRVLKRNKPLVIEQRKNHFLVKSKAGAKKFILKRDGKTKQTEVVYRFTNQAKIDKKFRFYEDAMDTTYLVFSGHMNKTMNRAIATSRFRRTK